MTTPTAAPAAPASTPADTSSAPPASAAPRTDASSPTNRDASGRFAGNTAQPIAPEARRESPAPGTPTEAQKAEAREIARRKYRLKVDGQEREEELSDDEVSVRLQKAAAAEKRMSEAAEIRKAYAQLKEIAKNDPAQILKQLAGVEDPRAWAEQLLAEQIRQEMLPPHEREKQELQRTLETERKARTELETRIQREAQAKADAEAGARLEQEFQATFQRLNLDWTPENVELVGQLALQATEEGVDLTPDQLAAEVQGILRRRDESADQRFRTRVTSLEGQALLDFLGPDVVRKALKASVTQYRTKPDVTSTPVPPQAPSTEGKQRKPLTPQEWRAMFKESRVGSTTKF